MKRTDLKELLKPLVKECIEESIHEVLFDSGIVAGVVSEVIKGVDIPQLVESMGGRRNVVSTVSPQTQSAPAPVQMSEVVNPQSATTLEQMKQEKLTEAAERRARLEQTMNDKFGISLDSGGSQILEERQGAAQADPMAGTDPNDPGVNIAAIPGLTTLDFTRHLKGGKE